jgi:hypothetical protein
VIQEFCGSAPQFNLLCAISTPTACYEISHIEHVEAQKVANIRTKIGLQIIAGMPTGPFLIWDSAVKGFCCRRQFSDAITYSVFFRTRTGLQRWMKIGRHGIITPTEARAEAVRILRAVTLGEDPANERYALRSGATMSELLDDYVADMQSGKINGKKSSTIISDNSRIKNHIRPKFGKLRVAAITQSNVEEFMNSMSPGSAKRIVILLGSIFTFAVNKGLRADNPCSKIKKPADVRRTRRLSEHEYAQLHKALGSVPNSIAGICDNFPCNSWLEKWRGQKPSLVRIGHTTTDCKFRRYKVKKEHKTIERGSDQNN